MKQLPQDIKIAQCDCGYEFLAMSILTRKYRSFGIINDRDYQRFVKFEVRVAEASEPAGKLRAIAKSSKYIGSVLECPDCGRLLVNMPGEDRSVYTLSRESNAGERR